MTEPNYTTYRQTDRLTDRETDRQTDKKPIKSTYGQTNKWRERQRDVLKDDSLFIAGQGGPSDFEGIIRISGGQKESVEIDKVWGGEDYGILTANEKRTLEYHRALGGIR